MPEAGFEPDLQPSLALSHVELPRNGADGDSNSDHPGASRTLSQLSYRPNKPRRSRTFTCGSRAHRASVTPSVKSREEESNLHSFHRRFTADLAHHMLVPRRVCSLCPLRIEEGFECCRWCCGHEATCPAVGVRVLCLVEAEPPTEDGPPSDPLHVRVLCYFIELGEGVGHNRAGRSRTFITTGLSRVPLPVGLQLLIEQSS